MGKDVRHCESGEEGVGGDGMERLLEGRNEMKWLLEGVGCERGWACPEWKAVGVARVKVGGEFVDFV